MPVVSWTAPRQAGRAWLLHDRRQQLFRNRGSPVCQATRPAPLDCSTSLAAARAAEAMQQAPLLADPYAATLAAQGRPAPALPSSSSAWDVLVARFLDEQLLKAASLVNVDLKQEYNQVVIVGDPMDTRPFRLPWPEGTVLYLVGEAEVHELAKSLLKEQGARVPRGCLLVRVNANLSGGTGFAAALERAGYRGDRLSVWALQGATSSGLLPTDVQAILADASNLAAYDSLVLGELPPLEVSTVANLVAEWGLLGGAVDLAGLPGWDRLQGSWVEQQQQREGELRPSLFISQQKRMSLQQMGIYSDHVAAAEETDEDFSGNFS